MEKNNCIQPRSVLNLYYISTNENHPYGLALAAMFMIVLEMLYLLTLKMIMQKKKRMTEP